MLTTNLIKLSKTGAILNYVKYSSNALAQHQEAPSSYPQILDISRNAIKQREKLAWHKEIQDVKSVEEKLIKINLPRYYGFKSLLINKENVPYNALPLIQHYTRTHFIEQNELHSFYNQHEENALKYLELVKKDIAEAIFFSYKAVNNKQLCNEEIKPSEIENRTAEIVINNLNRVIKNHLAVEQDHLFQGSIDFRPRIEAYWVAGGVSPPESVRKSRLGTDWLKEEVDVCVDRHIQYIGSPALTLRCKHPLSSVVPFESGTKDLYAVPHVPYDPRVAGFTYEHRHATNIPGFWPGDNQEFGMLSYHTRGALLDRPKTYDEKENQEALHTQGILHSYAWLLSQANYQGFNTYNDITYPLTTQTIITNGQKFSMYTYQLNTTLIHSDNYLNNEKVNLCWGTKEMNLFDAIDNDGKIINLNEKLLKQIIKYYINKPVERNIDMKPYLDKEKPHIAQIEDEEKRIWLESRYKHLVSNRARHRLPYEVYNWEKIYKIDHKTRPMEPRRRPFELGINPYKRRLNEHTPEYVPKCIRPGGRKSREKWAKTYYP